jgi:hypothetical protein
MSVDIKSKPDYPGPDAKPDPQSGDTGLIAFLRSMGIDESEAEMEAIEAYNRLMKAIGRECDRERNKI